jgi:hypothetical protein
MKPITQEALDEILLANFRANTNNFVKPDAIEVKKARTKLHSIGCHPEGDKFSGHLYCYDKAKNFWHFVILADSPTQASHVAEVIYYSDFAIWKAVAKYQAEEDQVDA